MIEIINDCEIRIRVVKLKSELISDYSLNSLFK